MQELTPGQKRGVLAALKRTKVEPNQIEDILGKTLLILPGVFSPKAFTDGQEFAEDVPAIVGNKEFLEIGTGTGLIACHVAENGATRVVATDINPRACENTRLNAQNRNVTIDVREGSVFEPVQGEKFDFIFWNHPFKFTEEPVEDVLLQSVFEQGYTNLEIYFRDGVKYLKSGGKLLLGTSSIARLDLIQEFAKKYGYDINICTSKSVAIKRGGNDQLKLFILECSPIQVAGSE